jgi:hypothetical protein
MTWMGPTYGMWADSVAETNAVIEIANQTTKSLEQWQAYAKRLERALLDVAEKHRKTGEAYISRVGAEAGQAALKEAALKELERLDPSNKLLDPTYRKSLYEKEREAATVDMKKK